MFIEGEQRRALFRGLGRLAMTMGLIRLGVVTFDGTRSQGEQRPVRDLDGGGSWKSPASCSFPKRADVTTVDFAQITASLLSDGSDEAESF